MKIKLCIEDCKSAHELAIYGLNLAKGREWSLIPPGWLEGSCQGIIVTK